MSLEKQVRMCCEGLRMLYCGAWVLFCKCGVGEGGPQHIPDKEEMIRLDGLSGSGVDGGPEAVRLESETSSSICVHSSTRYAFWGAVLWNLVTDRQAKSLSSWS